MRRTTDRDRRLRADGGDPAGGAVSDDGLTADAAESEAADGEEASADEEGSATASDGGSATDGGDAEAEADDAETASDDTVPQIDLGLYQITVSVTGTADDGLEDVEDTAERLLDRLVERAQDLEDAPDDRGLG